MLKLKPLLDKDSGNYFFIFQKLKEVKIKLYQLEHGLFGTAFLYGTVRI